MSSSRPSLVLLALAGLALDASAQGPATGALVTGRVELLNIDDRGDTWSSGTMVVGGQLVILPRNLILQLPANWLTLDQLFDQAPPAAQAKNVSGLAVLDGPEFTGAFATIHGNRNAHGNVIAGDVFIAKGTEVVNGVVTYVNHTDGYLRIDGAPGDAETGLMVRINDPEGRFTIQQGLGCDGGANCSPDVRFGVDIDNYTVTFATGYPAGIPSTVPVGLRPGFLAGDPVNAAADASGIGDPFCPATNRNVNPVPDSTRFAPIQLGDSITAEGNIEYVDGVRFLSCHTLTVADALTTQDSPTQPDYMIFDEAEWDVPSFDNQRIRLLLIGFTTLGDSQLDVFRLHVDPTTNQDKEFPLASTVGNPQTINQGLIPGNGGIFKVNYDVDFVALIPAGRSPCQNLINAGLGNPCPRGGTLAENIAILAPITREIIGRTRHKARLLPGIVTRDITGRVATNGEYLTPVGVGFPEFVEINLDGLSTPFSFDGVPWNLDRRLSPVGCDGNCESVAQPLDPFPWSGRDPAQNLPSTSRNELFQFYPFGPSNLLAWPPTAPGPRPITPLPTPAAPGIPFAAPQADFAHGATVGTAPLTVAFADTSTGNIQARLWDFGDGSYSTEPAPVHTYASAGSFTVALTALGFGGADVATRANLVRVDGPGGPDAPQADFVSDRTAGNVPLPVQFTDRSLGEVTSWRWDFGDGTTSGARHPLHTYTTGGRFTVTLVATGPGGSSSMVKLDHVTANVPGALDVDFVANTTSGVAPLVVRFRAINVSGQALTGTFDFGDGTTGTVGAGNGRISHTYSTPGTYTVTLTASDALSTDIEQKVGFITVGAARQL